MHQIDDFKLQVLVQFLLIYNPIWILFQLSKISKNDSFIGSENVLFQLKKKNNKNLIKRQLQE